MCPDEIKAGIGKSPSRTELDEAARERHFLAGFQRHERTGIRRTFIGAGFTRGQRLLGQVAWPCWYLIVAVRLSYAPLLRSPDEPSS